MVLKDIITEFQCFSLLWRPQISEFKVCLRVAPVAGDNKRAWARDHPRSYIYFSRSFHVKTGKFGGEIHPASRTCTPLDMSKNLASIFSDQNRQIWGAGVKSEHAWQTCTLLTSGSSKDKANWLHSDIWVRRLTNGQWPSLCPSNLIWKQIILFVIQEQIERRPVPSTTNMVPLSTVNMVNLHMFLTY